MHRIGRTGRSDNKGTSYTFFTPANGAKVDELVNILQESNQVRLRIRLLFQLTLIVAFFSSVCQPRAVRTQEVRRRQPRTRSRQLQLRHLQEGLVRRWQQIRRLERRRLRPIREWKWLQGLRRRWRQQRQPVQRQKAGGRGIETHLRQRPHTLQLSVRAGDDSTEP